MPVKLNIGGSLVAATIKANIGGTVQVPTVKANVGGSLVVLQDGVTDIYIETYDKWLTYLAAQGIHSDYEDALIAELPGNFANYDAFLTSLDGGTPVLKQDVLDAAFVYHEGEIVTHEGENVLAF